MGLCDYGDVTGVPAQVVRPRSLCRQEVDNIIGVLSFVLHLMAYSIHPIFGLNCFMFMHAAG